MYALHNIHTTVDIFNLEVGHQVFLSLTKLKPTSEETSHIGHLPLLLLIWPAKEPKKSNQKVSVAFLQGNAQKWDPSLCSLEYRCDTILGEGNY